MFCYKCGSGISGGSKFCASCGAAVSEPAGQQPSEQYTQPAGQQPSEQPAYPAGQQLSEQPASQQINEPATQPAVQQPSEQHAYPDNQQSDQLSTQPVYPYHTTNQPYYQQPYRPVSQPEYQQPYQPNAQPAFQQAYQPYPPQHPPALPKKGKQAKGMWWKVAVPAVFLISLITVGVIYLITLISPLATVSASIYNLGKELERRVEGTPMEMFGILFDSFESGSVTVDFHYSDLWEDARGIITLHTDDSNNEVAFEVDISTDGFAIDLELYSNRERIAARISQIDNNYYGIRYETFKDDFLPFADLLFLEQHDIDMVVNLVEMYNTAMEASGDSGSPYSQYGELIKNAISNASIIDERVDFISDGRSIRVNKVELTISDRMIIELLYDLLDLFENDDYIRSIFDAANDFQSGMYPYNSSPLFDELLREMRSEIRDLERELRGEIKIAFYIGSRSRLMRMEVDYNFLYDGDRTEFVLSLDFGSSAHDIWVFSFNSRGDRGSTEFSMSWSIRETSRGGETMFTIDSGNRYGSEAFAVILDWNDRGTFALSSSDEYSHDTLLSGTYNKINDGFSLEIDNPFNDSRRGENLQLKISAVSRSGHIKEIDYINIADWDLSLIQKVGGFFDDFGNTDTSMPPVLPPSIDPPVIQPEDPPPVPPPVSPPVTGDSGISEADLYGSWRFSHGESTYFFWSADHVEFHEGGEVTSSESLYMTDVFWFLDGNSLLLTRTDGSYSHYFTIEMDGDFLVITDSDNDIGYFERIN